MNGDGGDATLRYDFVRESSPGAADGVLCGRLEVADKVDGWVGFGFSSTGQMISSASGPKNIAVVGRVDDGTVKKFGLPGRYITELPQAEQTLINTNIEVVGDSIVMLFTKLLEEAGEVEIVDGPNDFISAKGSISGGIIAGHSTSEMKDFIYKDFSEDVPTTSPSSSPSTLPTVHPTDPTTAPTSAPTHEPSTSPTDYPTTANAVPCPPAGTPPVELAFGPHRFELAPPNTFCGIFIRKADGSLVPFARSYNGYPWEASPGPFASPSSGVTCTGPTTSPPPPSPDFNYDANHGEDSRMIAYVGNWQTCPSDAQVDAYSHLVIAFAVSYTWSPGKNVCDTQCNVSTPPTCENTVRQDLIDKWRAAGKKVILSFGGAGMGGSWSGDQNNW